MLKKVLLGTLVVFVGWAILDFVLHVLILGSAYEASPSLWRPDEEMKWWVMYFVLIVVAFVFTYIYARFFGARNTRNAITYGALWGLGAGMSMGYGSYSVMPLPYGIALAWFLGSIVEGAAAGFLLSLVVKDQGGAGA